MGALVDLFVWIYYRDCVEGLTRKCGGGLSLTISKRVVASLTHEVSCSFFVGPYLSICAHATHTNTHPPAPTHTLQRASRVGDASAR